jgi:hypothetical protein
VIEMGILRVSKLDKKLELFEPVKRFSRQHQRVYPFYLDANGTIFIWGRLECASPLLF